MKSNITLSKLNSLKNKCIFFIFSCLGIIFFTSFNKIPINKLKGKLYASFKINRSNSFLIDSVKADTVLKYAYSVIGTPYKWAGISPKYGFDCSGFVYWCFQHVGVTTARSSKGLWSQGVKLDSTLAKPGDLILFKGTNARTKGVGHVGIVISKKGQPLTFIHSSSSKAKGKWGVIVTKFGGTYYQKRYLGIRRVLLLK